MERVTCGGCHSTNLKPILDLGMSPLADEFPTTSNAYLRTYPLKLVRCHRCTLVQLTEIVPDKELWGGDYGFYTGASWVAAEYQRQYAAHLMKLFPRLARKGTVEIACNDGTMLQHFQEAGFPCLGVDPAHGPVERARSRGLNVVEGPFGRALAVELVSAGAPAGLIIANNVIAHVADLDDFVSGINVLLDRLGVAVIEFQYLVDLVTGNQIDHVYHEHRQFFSLKSLSWVLNRHGLVVTSVTQTTPQGGSLRVLVEHNGTSFPDHSVGHLSRAEMWLDHEYALDGLQGRADRIRQKIRKILLEHKDKRVAGYGASAKSTTLLNFCGIDSELVQYYVDTTPMKWGRYTPGTNIPIIDPAADSRAPDLYLLTIHNYLSEILRKESNYAGQWLVPIPVPVVI